MNNPYLTTQLIAYIGNKRALLSFLKDVFNDLASKKPVNRFADLFAGSGAVSRLAKTLGLAVHANDWEFYSYIINSSHICVDAREADQLFVQFGGLQSVLQELNTMSLIEDGYVSTFYAPERTETADYSKERLFYTRENALFIDTVREGIETMYPGWELPPEKLREKSILLASLIYQAATHANTSGVFKAFHKGFGGYGRDALSRITGRMKLLYPVLIDSRRKCSVTSLDAAEAAAGASSDLCYLDPPYNQHQYGSNYHMLNTIAKWDKPEHPISFSRQGVLQDKGGIRKDWVTTRSDFCYKETALSAFRNLLDNIDARYIALSYNTEGIMSYEDILELLTKRGRVELYSSEYVTYRGGRQSMSRKAHNVEFLIVCAAGETSALNSNESIGRFFLENRIRTLMRSPFQPEQIKQTFRHSGSAVNIFFDDQAFLGMEEFIYFQELPSAGDFAALNIEQLTLLYDLLSKCVISDKKMECEVLLETLSSPDLRDEAGVKKFEKRLLRALKKIAHKKYINDYREIADKINSYGLQFLTKEFIKLQEIAEKRFHG